MSESLAPVVLFCYNRPGVMSQTLTALANNSQASLTELFIYCDGPKESADKAQLDNIRKVREIAHHVNGFAKVSVIERDRNMGLANSVIAGVTEVIGKYGTAIVVEDDLLTSKHFLAYMNQALQRFRNDERVMQVSAHQFDLGKVNPQRCALIPFATSWGWATWKRAWDKFDAECKGAHEFLKNRELCARFDLNNSYPFSSMLDQQINKTGKVDSWAVRWWWKIFTSDGLSLFPEKSLVANIGFGEDATHTKSPQQSGYQYFDDNQEITIFPDSVKCDDDLWERVVACFSNKKDNSKPEPARSWWKRLIGKGN